MRKLRILVCCVLVLIALLVMTSVDAKKTPDKKNKKVKDVSKDKSGKDDSKKDKRSDVNPKMKAIHIKGEKKKWDRKIKNDSTEVPADALLNSVEVKQEKYSPPNVKDANQTALSEPLTPQNCSSTAVNSASESLVNIEKNVTSLWRHLSILSQPVHIHIHGGQTSSPRRHGDKSGKTHLSSDKDKQEYRHHYPRHSHHHSHGHSDNHSHDHSSDHRHRAHSHGHAHRGEDRDKSQVNSTQISDRDRSAGSQSHHNHSDRAGDRSHKSHSKSHSNTSHSHRRGDRSPYHSKYHSHGHKHATGGHYSPSQDGHHRGHYGFGDRSTHVHIHLTLDEKPVPVQQERNESLSTTAAPVPQEPVFGRCDFRNSNSLIGYVLLRQSSGVLDVKVNISGFNVSATDPDRPEQRLHGFHVHEFGDFSNGCLSFGSHYNPEGTTHGGLTHDIRHAGDWGNIEVNDHGEAVTYLFVNDASLLGPHSILGRGIVVHEHLDDLGEGGVPASETTGNAGGRLACCIIGHSKPLPAEAFQQTQVDPADSFQQTQVDPADQH